MTLLREINGLVGIHLHEVNEGTTIIVCNPQQKLHQPSQAAKERPRGDHFLQVLQGTYETCV